MLDYTNLFFPYDYEKNDKTAYEYFKDTHGKRKHKPWLKTKEMDETINSFTRKKKMVW